MLQTFWPRLEYFLIDFSTYLIILAGFTIVFILLIFKIFKLSSSKTKKFCAVILAIIYSLIVCFTAAEFYFRYVYDQPDGLGFLKVNRKWHERHVIYNSYYFRDRDFNPNKNPVVTRIGVLGDSITFGGGIENVNDRFSNLLEKKLNEAGYRVEVYNLGKPGYDTDQEIIEYQKIKHLNFDIIIWQYFLNDIQPQEKSTGSPIIAANSQIKGLAEFLSGNSYFVDFLYWRFSTKYRQTYQQLLNADLAQYQNDQVLTSHKAQIQDFILSLKNDNKKVIVIIFPFVHLIDRDYPAREIHHMMLDYFKEKSVEVIDLLPDLANRNPQTSVASRFDPHPNELVHAQAAQRLFEKVRQML